MRRINYVLAVAALFVSAAFLASCSKSETTPQPEDPQTIQFTATLAPKAEGTKAITIGTDGGKEILNVAWKANEKIAIYYEKTDGTFDTATANVDAVDPGTGVATISASLPDAKNGRTAKFVFPASLATSTGDINESQLLNNQNGLLRTDTKNISKSFDAATATGTISVNGNEASVSGSVKMENQVCICKMTLTFEKPQSTESDQSGANERTQAGTTLTIAVGDGRTYTIKSPFTTEDQMTSRPFQTDDVIYVAMLPIASQTVTFSSDGFSKTSENVTLEAGKFYRNLPIKCIYNPPAPPTPHTPVTQDLSTGHITAYDGDTIIQSQDGSTTNTITIVDGATVTIRDITVSSVAAGITCNDSATIILEGANSIHSSFQPAIMLSAGNLTIEGNGSLNVSTSSENPAIGGDRAIGGGGNITIAGGTIEARGGYKSAAIGGAHSTACHSITITSGVTRVTAIKGDEAPYSIGPGEGSGMIIGAITIGGTVYHNGSSFQNGGEDYLAQSPLVYEPQH
ncbi:MAG TPA: hypothetical protein DCG33_00675 [Prevotellaceae bacterium]|nr:hypothetical protein [Prevotellaceae bacterium]